MGGRAHLLNPPLHADPHQNIKHTTENYERKEFIFLPCAPLLRGVAGYINLNHKQIHATEPSERASNFRTDMEVYLIEVMFLLYLQEIRLDRYTESYNL